VIVDDLLEDEVGFVEPALWARPGGVVDLRYKLVLSGGLISELVIAP